jgi:hypothetical protein
MNLLQNIHPNYMIIFGRSEKNGVPWWCLRRTEVCSANH